MVGIVRQRGSSFVEKSQKNFNFFIQLSLFFGLIEAFFFRSVQRMVGMYLGG